MGDAVTMRERIENVLGFCFAAAIGFGLFVGGIWWIGGMVDGVTYYKTERDRCLKQATNGYDIERCRR